LVKELARVGGERLDVAALAFGIITSNARLDLPDPLSPVTTVKVLRGTSTLMFFRLCWRAPRTVMRSIIRPASYSEEFREYGNLSC
jgi:hypothetical protein